MKFTKPITREVDIDGNTFNVTFNDTGIEFRLKGKRKTARADWTDVLNIARGEQGESARELLGISEASSTSTSESQPQGRAFQSETGQQNAPAFQPQGSEQGRETAASEEDSNRAGDEISRSVTAGEVGPES